eukprot:scaffold6369_cov77-Skeletonema_dohrnii-CCMP3373.AAC.4
MAANNGNEGGGGHRDIFVYMGGEQVVPEDVTHVRIDKSVEVIEDFAFNGCEYLVQVETHDRIRKIGWRAFNGCISLRIIDLRSVVEIGMQAFEGCENLTDVKFGDKLETIGKGAFDECISLERLKLPSVITVRWEAFVYCEALQRIAIPLKRDLLPFDPFRQEYNQFSECDLLATVDLVGGSHSKTIASLHMECWGIEMIEEINRINQVLPNTPADEKTAEIKQWMDSVIDKMDHYKAEHHRYVKEAITLLELALWKAKLGEREENSAEGKTEKKVKLDSESVRKEKRITCGADTVIKNVIPFLQLE